MPIFGLVWVASWVSCFFSSSQDLLRAPAVIARVLPIQAAYGVSDTRDTPDDRLIAFSHDRGATVLSPRPVQPFASLVQTAPQAQALSFALALDGGTVLPDSINLLGALKNLLSGFQKLTATRQTPPVVVTRVEQKREKAPNVERLNTSGLGFGQCVPIAQRHATADSARPNQERKPQSLFQVKIKDYIVGAAPSQQQATQLAYHLEQALNDTTANHAKAQLDQLQPSVINGVPGGKLGDRVLFTVDQQVADQWDCNAEMLAIQWVNALRTAVAQPPLALADAQAKMYDLQATGQRLEGIASWYGPYFHGRRTATGETFNQNNFTAAHPSLPFDTYLKVTNIANGKAVIVRVNDRGPYFEKRTLDLSREAARCLDSETNGVVSVEAEIMQPASKATSGQAIAGGL